MKIFVKKTLQGLIPADRTEFDKLQDCKLKLGEYYEVEIKKKRNIKFHRKLFSLLNLCFNNQEHFNSIDELRAYVTMKAGYFVRTSTPDGEFFTPKSISFSNMDQVEFDDFYDKVFQQIIKLLDCEDEDLLNALKDY
jgi:hypothetical protein